MFEEGYLVYLVNSMQVWLFMNLIFSFASYGLSSYEWYLFGGLSVVAGDSHKLLKGGFQRFPARHYEEPFILKDLNCLKLTITELGI